jgi:hypothetical protein
MTRDADGTVADPGVNRLLALAAELERRDEVVARQIDEVAALAERAGAVRADAAAIAEQLAAIPSELEVLDRAESDARAAARSAHRELAELEARLADLESARRPRDEEIERVRRTTQDARETVADAEARITRLQGRRVELDELERALVAAADGAVVTAREVASAIASVPRVSAGGRAEPGATLAELDEWGGRARAALFVVRGTLDAERERIVIEAGSLGASVLGEDMAGTSVALVRQRLEQALR